MYMFVVSLGVSTNNSNFHTFFIVAVIAAIPPVDGPVEGETARGARRDFGADESAASPAALLTGQVLHAPTSSLG